MIIPARLQSTRLPAKLLRRLPDGRSVLEHTWRAASRSRRADGVWIATDSPALARHARRFGAAVIDTGEHNCGTDRVAEAAEKLDLDGDAIVVNLQGDEPTMRPELIDALIDFLRCSPYKMATLACPISASEQKDRNTVKVALEGDRATVFQRDPLLGGWKHVGIYAYRLAFLRRFVAWTPTENERRHRLEQLRALDRGVAIGIIRTRYRPQSIDTPADLQKVAALIDRLALPGLRQNP